MTLQEAVHLIKTKYLEEQQGVTDGPAAKRWESALLAYPVTMSTAQIVWGHEVEAQGKRPQPGLRQ